MSWWVYLNEDDALVKVESRSDGGTYIVGGTDQAELNITYNYSPLYHKHFNEKDGLSWLEGRTAKECIPTLEKAVSSLGVERDNDYWKATEGNAGYALSILLEWAKANPEATFSVS